MMRATILAMGAIVSSCSCAAVHELDGGLPQHPDTNVDAGPPLFPMCGNPNLPGNCSGDDACLAWAGSFGVVGTVDAVCWELRTGDGSSLGSYCQNGSTCPDGHQGACLCSATHGCALGEVCVRDPAGGPSQCVPGCTDLSRCYPSRIEMRTDTHPGFTQADYCPTDAGP